MDSILDTIKDQLGVSDSETAFDNTIIMDINTAMGYLTEMGVGPSSGYSITSKAETWANFLGTDVFEPVKSYLHLKTKLLFDPPANTNLMASIEHAISEAEWRITNHYDVTTVTTV
jgi:hypothetical protein